MSDDMTGFSDERVEYGAGGFVFCLMFIAFVAFCFGVLLGAGGVGLYRIATRLF